MEPSRRHRPSIALAAVAVLLLAWAALPRAAAAYVVVLKDGSEIVADREYEVREGRAIITLPNGTRTFLKVDEIDREATEEANRQGYGQARVIEDADANRVKTAEPESERRKTLADLTSGETDLSRLQQHRRQDPEAAEAGTTLAGYPDLSSLTSRPFRDLDISSEVQRFFRGQGIDGVELYQGSRPGHLLAEVTTNSEASVFRTLEVAAQALLATRDSHPDAVGALELFLATPDRERAGQFILTPELARELVQGETEVARFFVEHVQF